MKILVVRFRQMGDAILATALLNTLRHNFPEAQIDFVLNEKIAPLFEGHPAISNIITFSEQERHSTLTYMRKVWHTVHATHYDAIIDMRSTVNTMLFALFSPSTRFRIGVKKGYTWLAFNRQLGKCGTSRSMVDYDVAFAEPLKAIKDIEPVKEFTLHISDEEKADYGEYLTSCGIDLKRPILLANVTAKLANKVWDEERMTWVLSQFLNTYPEWQVIFNYAPGDEEKNARRIYERLGNPQQVFIDVKARSSRQLVALGTYCSLFFGNEGGARHIIHSAGCRSLVVCAPGNAKQVWIPQTNIKAEGIAPSDFADADKLATLDRAAQYALIGKEYVWEKLDAFVKTL